MTRGLLPRTAAAAIALAISLAASLVVIERAPAATSDSSIKPAAALWTRYGGGWLRDFELADLDKNGTNELVVGAKGVGALDQRSLATGRYRWMNKWPNPADASQGDDNEIAYDIATGDVTGDGVPDTLAGTSMGVMGFDGKNGHELYQVTNDNGSFNDAQEIATADFNDDGAKDIVYSFLSDARLYAADGTDGSLLWQASRGSSFTTQIGTSDLNDDGFTDTLVIGSGGIGAANVEAFSGFHAAETHVASPLWSQTFPGGDPAVFAIGQVVAGGPREIVVGGYLGQVGVLNATTGATLGTWKVDGHVSDIELVNMDSDDDLEIAVATGFNDDNGNSTVVDAFDPTGTQLWAYDAGMPPLSLDSLDLDKDGRSELVVGGGWFEFHGHGENDGLVAALDPRVGEGAPRELWRATTPTQVGQVDHGTILGGPTILAGEYIDPYVRGFSYDGKQRFEYRLGGYPRDVATADIDGDGKPEILEGATDAEVAVHDRRGNTLWHARVPGSATPDVETVSAGQLTNDPGREVIAGTFEFTRGEGGFVRVYTSKGHPLWSDEAPGPVGTVLGADLDHDKKDEVLAANSGPGLSGDGAQIARYAGDGKVLWKSPTPPSMFGPYVGITDVNNDSVDDVIVLTLPFGHSFVLAYDGATGKELWRYDVGAVGQWLDVIDGPHGIAVGDIQGEVVRLDVATGQPDWTVQFDGPSRDGGFTADANGDGNRDIVTTGDSALVHELDDTDGSELWSKPLDGDDLGLRVAPIAQKDGDYIAVGAYTNSNGERVGIYFFDVASGERVARFETEGHAQDIEPVDVNGDGNEEAVTAAGLQIYAIDLSGAEPEPDPEPEPEPTPTTTPTAEPSPSSSPTTEPTTEPSPTPESNDVPNTYEDDGHIAAFNPVAKQATGVTETDFLAGCSESETQGLDGYVFEIPDAFGKGTASGEVTGANVLGLHDLDAYFYDADCEEAPPPAATAQPDEMLTIPLGTRFVVVDAVMGIDTSVHLELATPTGGAEESTAEPSPTPVRTTTPSVSPSPTQSASPKPTPSASSEVTPEGTGRRSTFVTIEADRSTVGYRDEVTLSGIAGGDSPCAPKTVEVQARRADGSRYREVGTADVTDGAWSLTIRPERNAFYVARPAECDSLRSSEISVLVKPRITIESDIGCRPGMKVRGRLIPVQQEGRVILQRKVNGRWEREDSDRLNKRSRFVVAVERCGGAHRIKWAGNDSNAPSSEALRLR